MNHQQRTEINAFGEFNLIHHLTKNIDIKNTSSILGVGDDCAVIDALGKQIVVSTDMLVEDVHFDLIYTPLKHLGYKSVITNISDIYAMNAKPTQILLAIALSNRMSVEDIELFYEGVYAACNDYQVDLVGGDTTSSKKGFIVSITAIGEVEMNEFVTRSGAKPNDLLCVSGTLGGAYLGLTLLEREKKIFLENSAIQPDLENEKFIVGKLLMPSARKDIIEFLAKEKIIPTSMMDISDGLSSECFHICEKSAVGCKIYEEKVPIHIDAKQAAIKFNLDPITAALHGGEDYELLFTIQQKDYEKITLHEDISVIGYITDIEKGLHLITKSGREMPLTAQGWQSFNKK